MLEVSGIDVFYGYILMAGILYFRPRGLFPPRHR